MKTNQLLEWIDLLKKRPHMIISEVTIDYQILKIYMEGYIDGFGQATGKNLTKDISIWYKTKNNLDSALSWTDCIRHFHKKKNR